MRERKIGVCHIIGDVMVFRKHVGAEIPHAECRRQVESFHLRFEDFKRVLDREVLEGLRDAFIGAKRCGDGAGTGEGAAEIGAEIHGFGNTGSNGRAFGHGLADTAGHGFAKRFGDRPANNVGGSFRSGGGVGRALGMVCGDAKLGDFRDA